MFLFSILLIFHSIKKKKEPHLEELWINLFRVLDDINETVAKAAIRLAQKLTNLTKRLVFLFFLNKINN